MWGGMPVATMDESGEGRLPKKTCQEGNQNGGNKKTAYPEVTRGARDCMSPGTVRSGVFLTKCVG